STGEGFVLASEANVMNASHDFIDISNDSLCDSLAGFDGFVENSTSPFPLSTIRDFNNANPTVSNWTDVAGIENTPIDPELEALFHEITQSTSDKQGSGQGNTQAWPISIQC